VIMDAGGTEPTAQPRQLDDLPGLVRQQVIDWAAAALGAAMPTEIPAPLARIARFAPAKRARLARAALGQAVQDDPAFRALVAAFAVRSAADVVPIDTSSTDPASTGTASTDPSSTDPASTGTASTDPSSTDPASTGTASTDAASTDAASTDAAPISSDPISSDPTSADPTDTNAPNTVPKADSNDTSALDAGSIDHDPIAAAARGFLAHSPDLAGLLVAAEEVDEAARNRARIVELERQIRVLGGKLERATAESRNKRAGAQRIGPDAGSEESTAEADRLRLRLRAQGTQIR
jgi:hypothetical protein